MELPPLENLIKLPCKALTISQPYAELIASGAKWVENRTWRTNYRGPLAIHAGQGSQYLSRRFLKNYQTGGFVAVAYLRACSDLQTMQSLDRGFRIIDSKLTIGDVLDHECTEGPFCWILDNVQPCKFLPCRGEQGLWTVPGNVQ